MKKTDPITIPCYTVSFEKLTTAWLDNRDVQLLLNLQNGGVVLVHFMKAHGGVESAPFIPNLWNFYIT